MSKATSDTAALSAAVGRLAATVARLFYRLDVVGTRPPATGPLLVVANHPNSLLDTALVTLATGRPGRFLAKATLFDDPKLAWLVRASGAIPVHRQQDAALTGATGPAANAAMFDAAEGALAAGDAIALFPEGISHTRPGLAPLKTGAARLALGAARRLGGGFPLVPVGITLEERETFRSAGLVVVGAPVAWDDLAAAVLASDGGDLDHGAVRALTARIDEALRAVTASYETWDDARLVALAERVHAAAVEAARLGLRGSGGGPPLAYFPAPSPPTPPTAGIDEQVDHGADGANPANRLTRYNLGAALLGRARTAPGPEGEAARASVDALAGELRAHERLLRAARLTPADLAVPSDVGTAAGWARRRVALPLVVVLALVGAVLGWVPYRLTGIIAGRVAGREDRDVLATAKALVGGLCFLTWLVVVAAVAGWVAGWWGALLVFVAGPALLVTALVGGDGLRGAWRDARRFFTLRGRPERVAGLRARQARLAREVEALAERLAA